MKNSIPRKNVPGATLTGDKKITPPVEPEPVDVPQRPEFSLKKDNTMLSFFQRLAASKVGRTVTGLVGGLLGFGGGAAAGLDIEFAVLVAGAALVACFLGVDKAVKFFTAINDARTKNQKSE